MARPGIVERTDAQVADDATVDRAVGALVGAAVADALGAPFEFRPGGAYRATFPAPVLDGAGEMIGNALWEPGEVTDDTQMAVLLAQSLLDRGCFDAADVFDRFAEWARSEPKDVGISTRAVLTSGAAWDEAAAAWLQGHPDGGAGNGSLMRTLPAALFFASSGTAVTMDAAIAQSDLTHGDPAAAAGCAIQHELVRVALAGGDPLGAIEPAIAEVEARLPGTGDRYRVVLAADWTPGRPGPGNGSVWTALAQSLWSLRQGGTYEDVVTRVIDLGDDADTVGAICGGLAGAVHGAGAIPPRWTAPLHGHLPGRRFTLDDLEELARRLVGGQANPASL